MNYTPAHIAPLLQDLKKGLASLYGNQLVHVILFGSYARKQASEDSDIDILTVLHGDVKPGREIDKMGELITDLCLQYGELISIVPVSDTVYHSKASLLMHSVYQEGMLL